MASPRHARSKSRAIPAALAWAAVLLFQLAMPAHAQRSKGERKEDPAMAAATAQKKEKARQVEEAYRASLKAIPDKPAPDPWGGMRK